MTAITKEQIINCLKEVYDPEIGINVVDLGLIYEIEMKKGTILVKMVLTSPSCPLPEVISSRVKNAIIELEGVDCVTVRIEKNRRWSPDMMTEEGRRMLDNIQ
ncbi:MAG TPA: metal-sulfur cluster assembly factor [Thermodesulfobacteriota bacterium]|nr:metal-sulfur cluster assembly factor [Thermodesulfobacteriota bacterium]